MKRGRALFTACLMLCAGTAHAYAPGTVGFVYEDCKIALEHSKSPAEFLPTYCGGFVEGYGMGVLAANSFMLGDPNEMDPCKDAKKKEYERINARLCKNIPDYRDAQTPPGTILQTVSDIIERWRIHLDANKNMKTFDKPAQTEINAVITPGAFCDSIKTTEAPKPLPISAGLLSANWYDFVKTGTPSLRDKYIACKADLEKKDFNATRCGAEITGFMAGLSSTSGLQKREESKGTCKKEIDRLYESLNMTDRLCLMPNTDPKLVAKIFLSRIESLEMERENTNVSGFGAVGYQSIYYGLLCRAQ